MKFLTLPIIALLPLLSTAEEAKTNSCQPSPKAAPKLVHDFSISLILGAPVTLGTGIDNSNQTYLPVTGGTFRGKWNGGVSGTIAPLGTVFYRQYSVHVYKLDLEYLLVTNDEPKASILVKQSGWEVDYVGRTQYVFETGDKRYLGLNSGVWTGVETGYVVNSTGTYSSADAYKVI